MAEEVLYAKSADVATVTLNRPAEGNIVSTEMGLKISQFFERAVKDEAKVIIFRGRGENFCIGRDVSGLKEHGDATAIGLREANTDPALKFYDSFLTTPIPIIGVVDGWADGMGCALAALCDITIASETARFRVPEMNRDIPPGLVMTAFRDRVHRKAIAYLVYSRDEIDAVTAREFGIVSRIVKPGDLDKSVAELSAKLSENSMSAIKMVKEYLNNALDMDRRSASSYASALLSNVMSSH
mgnify:CR=1 FL=1